MGYAGGEKKNPLYHSLGDHSEAIEVDYDPSIISYRELLEAFWSAHNATTRPWSQQYRSAVFYRNDEQKMSAGETLTAEEARRGKKVLTDIAPLIEFHPAEDYHQKYYLRHDDVLWEDFTAMYPNFTDLRDSTAAARVNGFLAGEGSLALLEAEIGRYGLSPRAAERLLKVARRAER